MRGKAVPRIALWELTTLLQLKALPKREGLYVRLCRAQFSEAMMEKGYFITVSGMIKSTKFTACPLES